MTGGDEDYVPASATDIQVEVLRKAVAELMRRVGALERMMVAGLTAVPRLPDDQAVLFEGSAELSEILARADRLAEHLLADGPRPTVRLGPAFYRVTKAELESMPRGDLVEHGYDGSMIEISRVGQPIGESAVVTWPMRPDDEGNREWH